MRFTDIYWFVLYYLHGNMEIDKDYIFKEYGRIYEKV